MPPIPLSEAGAGDKTAGVLDNDNLLPSDQTVSMSDASNSAHASYDVRALQAPLRSGYIQDASLATVVDLAWTEGGTFDYPMSGRVHFGSHATAQIDYGVHRAIGGTHIAPVPGDLLCAAVASCQESSLRMVANVLGVRLVELHVAVRAVVDVRGTLGMKNLVPVGFQSIQVRVHLIPGPETHPLRLRQMVRAAERACVVLQTLRAGVPTTMDVELPAAFASPARTNTGPTLT